MELSCEKQLYSLVAECWFRVKDWILENVFLINFLCTGKSFVLFDRLKESRSVKNDAIIVSIVFDWWTTWQNTKEYSLASILVHLVFKLKTVVAKMLIIQSLIIAKYRAKHVIDTFYICLQAYMFMAWI